MLLQGVSTTRLTRKLFPCMFNIYKIKHAGICINYHSNGRASVVIHLVSLISTIMILSNILLEVETPLHRIYWSFSSNLIPP